MPVASPAEASRPPLVSLADLVYLLYPVLPIRAVRALARLQTPWLRVTERHRWRAVRANLAALVEGSAGQGSADLLTRRFFTYRQIRRAFIVLGPKLDGASLDRFFPLEGLEHLDRALAAERGVVLLGSHLNSMCGFLARYQLQRRGYDARLSLPVDEPPFLESRVRRLLDRLAGRPPNAIFDGLLRIQFNVRPLMRALAERAAVLMVGDGWHSSGFVEAELLGRRVLLTSGPIGAAYAAGAPVIPLFCDGIPGECVRLCLEEPILPPPGAGPAEAVRVMVRDFAGRLDRRLRANPACWEHWQEPHALDEMARLSDRPVSTRYRV
jgi:KDO2-lipid IV(A) lauroyltransferase